MKMLQRARAAAFFPALVVTIDTGVPGLRERDLRNGIKPPRGRGVSGIPDLGQMIAKPGWVAGKLGDGRPHGIPERSAAVGTDAVR